MTDGESPLLPQLKVVLNFGAVKGGTGILKRSDAVTGAIYDTHDGKVGLKERKFGIDLGMKGTKAVFANTLPFTKQCAGFVDAASDRPAFAFNLKGLQPDRG